MLDGQHRCRTMCASPDGVSVSSDRLQSYDVPAIIYPMHTTLSATLERRVLNIDYVNLSLRHCVGALQIRINKCILGGFFEIRLH